MTFNISIHNFIRELKTEKSVKLSQVPFNTESEFSIYPPNHSEDIRYLRGERPDCLLDLYELTDGLVLFYDKQYGLHIYSLQKSLIKTLEFIQSRGEQYVTGDIIIGEFFGDTDLVLCRSDKKSKDFGDICIVEGIYDRKEWSIVGTGLLGFLDFISRYYEAEGEKYWD